MDPKYVNIGEPEDKVIEELSEVIFECTKLIKEICKARRFGYFNYHPDEPDKLNIDRIKSEMEDCTEAFEKLEIKLRKLKFDFFKEKNDASMSGHCF
jgi:hypothetical protein